MDTRAVIKGGGPHRYYLLYVNNYALSVPFRREARMFCRFLCVHVGTNIYNTFISIMIGDGAH